MTDPQQPTTMTTTTTFTLTTPINGIIFDLDETLTHGFTTPDIEGEPMPYVLEVLAHLTAFRVPFMEMTNQAGPLYRHFSEQIWQVKPEWRGRAYPTVEQVIEKLVKAITNLGLLKSTLHPIYIATYDPYVTQLTGLPESQVKQAALDIALQIYDELTERGVMSYVSEAPEYRKPRPGALFEAQHEIEAQVATIQKRQPHALPHRHTFYIGDMYTPKVKAATDEWAAKNGGFSFWPAERIQELLAITDFQARPAQPENWKGGRLCLECGTVYSYIMHDRCPTCGSDDWVHNVDHGGNA